MDKDRFERFLARAEHLADLTGYDEIAEAERRRRIAELKRKAVPVSLLVLHRMFFAEQLSKIKPQKPVIQTKGGLEDWKGWSAVVILGGWILTLTSTALAVMIWYPASIPWVLASCLLMGLGVGGMNLAVSYHKHEQDFLDKDVLTAMNIGAVFLLPGWAVALFAVAWAIGQYDDSGAILDHEKLESGIADIRALPAGALVRDFAVGEIDRIKSDILGPQSELVQAEGALQSRLNEAEAMRVQVMHRLNAAGPERAAALEKGMEVAHDRVSEIRNTLNRHREVMVRARAILDECRASAQGLSEAVADAELLRNLEEQAMQDERHIALSELAMEQAVDRLRQRVMSLEGALAQLQSQRLVATEKGDVEQQAYLGRIETVAEKLAAI